MVSIKDRSPLSPLKQPLKEDGRPGEDSQSFGTDQRAGKEYQVPVLLAKSAVAVKMRIVAGMGDGNAVPRPEKPSECAEDPGGLSMKQERFNDGLMLQNLKEIVADYDRWNLFALGALDLQPGAQACDTLRNCLQEGFKEDTGDGMVKPAGLYSVTASNHENTGACTSSEDPSAGLIERTKLWLTFPGYFETLFSAVREKSLSKNIDLYTDERLIRYLDTIGQ